MNLCLKCRYGICYPVLNIMVNTRREIPFLQTTTIILIITNVLLYLPTMYKDTLNVGMVLHKYTCCCYCYCHCHCCYHCGCCHCRCHCRLHCHCHYYYCCCYCHCHYYCYVVAVIVIVIVVIVIVT